MGDNELECEDDTLKPAINAALYPLCPATMTLGEFEHLACKVFNLVMGARTRARQAE